MTRRSQAIVKFHLNDQKQLIDLINKARIQKGCTLVDMYEKEEMSTELANMRKNRQRVKFREADRLLEEQRKSKKLQKQQKTGINI